MPWPEVKFTVRRPVTAKAVAPPCAACSPSRLDRDLLLAPDVQFALRVRLLVNLAALGRRRDRIKDAALGDARLDVLRDELVAVAGDPDAGIFRLVCFGFAIGPGGNDISQLCFTCHNLK